ncbi:hypothetical protein ACJ72_08580, partial [Emergomyces africanus]
SNPPNTMRLSIAAVASLLTLVSAQGLGGLPDCAKACAGNAIPKECGLDVKCICTAEAFLTGITCCVAKSCNEEDQKSKYALYPLSSILYIII